MGLRTLSPPAFSLGICLLILVAFFHSVPARADWLADLETNAVAWMQEAGIPGMAIAIVQNDTVVFAKGFGHLSMDPASAQVDANTVFDIGSCSKAFAATRLAMLADQGPTTLAWTDLVSTHLPSFQMYDPWVNGQFNVEDLLVHRSGLPFYSLFGMMFLGYPADDVVRGLRYEHPVASFRSTFAYQNDMYMAASKLIEAKTGKTWAEDLSASLLTPLSMTRTVTTQAEKNALQNVALGQCLLSDGTLWTIPPDWSNSFLTDSVLAAGAIRSSANDMAKWLRLHLGNGAFGGNRLVSEAGMRYLHAPIMFCVPWASGVQSPYWGPVSYGGGWQYFGLAPQPFLVHDGTLPGFKASVGLIPGAEAGIVVLTNMGSDFSGNPTLTARSQVAQRITFRFYDLFLNRSLPPGAFEDNMARLRALSPEATPPAATAATACDTVRNDLPLARHTGTYVNPAYGAFVVTESGGHLEITMGPRHIRAVLTPSGGAFVASLPDYPSPYDVNFRFSFEFPASGPAVLHLDVAIGWPQYERFTRIASPGTATMLLLDNP